MAVLEIGINIGMKNLVEVKYYSSSDNILDPDIRAKFLSGLKSCFTEVFGDKINVISLLNFEIVCYFKMVELPGQEDTKTQPLLSFAIIEKGTDHTFVKQHLKEIISQFLNRYPLNDIFKKKVGRQHRLQDRRHHTPRGPWPRRGAGQAARPAGRSEPAVLHPGVWLPEVTRRLQR